ncbi:MAG: hypothetical protein AAGJ81_10420 [Verrucomicrobiota bacterium]
MNTQNILLICLYIGGAGQIFVALIYEWVRRILDWDADVDRMSHIWNRQIVHTYSRYIQGINFVFGVITLGLAPYLLDGHPVSRALSGVIALYWGGRLIVALGYYDTMTITRTRRLYRTGAWFFNGLFAYLAVVYGWVALLP